MTEPIVLDHYHDIKEALYHPDLSRGLDDRSYKEGNPRAEVLSVLHGDPHKQRRRLENKLFRRDALVEYEHELFPGLVDNHLEGAGRKADLFRLGGELSVVLAARRAGIDHDGGTEQLAELWRAVLALAQAAAVLDVVGDTEPVLAAAYRVLGEFDEQYVTPSRRRREDLLDAAARGTAVDVPDDLLTVALQAMRAGRTDLDHNVLVREAGLYLHGGSHTSAQTLCNVLSLLLGVGVNNSRPDLLDAAGSDIGFAQRCVHETLRLRPTTPGIKRVAVHDAVVAGRRVVKDQRVVLDIATANRDPDLFGETADTFDPHRRIEPEVPLWGLSFGAGPHICIGRSVAGGFPLHHGEPDDGHLHGLVARMVQAIAARRPALVESDPPMLDKRTDRGTRWARFPVRLQTPAVLTVHGPGGPGV